MDTIYMDNACTSFPKPPSVAAAVCDFIANYGVNINRGSYGPAYEMENVVYQTRVALSRLFGYSDCKNVIFTANITTSLNMVLKVCCGREITSWYHRWEHNASCVLWFS